jgi:hypothetical protein
MITSVILASLMFSLPASVESLRSEITQLVEQRTKEFLTQCYKWQPPKKCNQAVERAEVTIVDDFVFPSKSGKYGFAKGQYTNIRNIKVSLYERIETNQRKDCANSPLIRDRGEMHRLSGDRYWLTHQYAYFCARPTEQLPAPVFIHELCHFFGARIGHTGKEECQPSR